MTAATRINPGKLSLGEGTSGPTTHAITLKNTGKTPVTYTLSSVNAVTTGTNDVRARLLAWLLPA